MSTEKNPQKISVWKYKQNKKEYMKEYRKNQSNKVFKKVKENGELKGV